MTVCRLKSIAVEVAIAALCAVLLPCCASKSVDLASCDNADWYELGRRDGSQGAPADKIGSQRRSCKDGFRSDWETMYTNGRNAGLVEYCDPKNGYELGRMGIAYMYVCPSTVEPTFLTSYRRGQRAHDLELESKKLDVQIDQLSQKLLVSNDKFDQRELASQLDQLKHQREVKERELSKIIAK